MKKLAIATVMMICLAGAGFAQTAPAKKTKAQKMEMKKDDKASSDTSMHKHMHKGTKHMKAKA
jgi:hypothetical protein